MADPISDMLSRIKNAQGIRAEMVDIPHSRIKEEIVKILAAEGFIGKFEILKRMEKKFLRVALKYRENKRGLIAGLKRVSKPGRRVYSDFRSLFKVQAGFGLAVVSTSRGIMTDEEARAKKLGGEVMLKIW
ncbi:MAG: 30S ribosomal protein S8 [Candidatus Margulisbacteria bacterium]|nr:30S ribosomal protein S8 [Candidatus Margulisiibacteriota bacterium]